MYLLMTSLETINYQSIKSELKIYYQITITKEYHEHHLYLKPPVEGIQCF